MRTNRLQGRCTVFLTLLVSSGCTSQGPIPDGEATADSPAPKLATSDTSGAHPGAADPTPGAGTADPQAGTRDPHAGLTPDDKPQGPAKTWGQADASGRIDLGAISIQAPKGWQVRPPKSSMRRAELSAPGSAGPAELVVYYFGPGGAGSTASNVERWIGQFTNADGSPASGAEQSTETVAGLQVTKVAVSGRYVSGMGPRGEPEAPRANTGMLAAIIETQGGPYYFKLLGPKGTVMENQASFDALLTSTLPSP